MAKRKSKGNKRMTCKEGEKDKVKMLDSDIEPLKPKEKGKGGKKGKANLRDGGLENKGKGRTKGKVKMIDGDLEPLKLQDKGKGGKMGKVKIIDGKLEPLKFQDKGKGGKHGKDKMLDGDLEHLKPKDKGRGGKRGKGNDATFDVFEHKDASSTCGRDGACFTVALTTIAGEVANVDGLLGCDRLQLLKERAAAVYNMPVYQVQLMSGTRYFITEDFYRDLASLEIGPASELTLIRQSFMRCSDFKQGDQIMVSGAGALAMNGIYTYQRPGEFKSKYCWLQWWGRGRLWPAGWYISVVENGGICGVYFHPSAHDDLLPPDMWEPYVAPRLSKPGSLPTPTIEAA